MSVHLHAAASARRVSEGSVSSLSLRGDEASSAVTPNTSFIVIFFKRKILFLEENRNKVFKTHYTIFIEQRSHDTVLTVMF